MTWDEVTRLLDGAGNAHLATADPSGRPHVSTVAVAVEGTGLWFATRRSSGKAGNLLANARVALMWAGNRAETYLWGTVEVVDDPQERERIWTGGVLPYDPSALFGPADDPATLLLRVTPERVLAMVQGEAGLARQVWTRDPSDA